MAGGLWEKGSFPPRRQQAMANSPVRCAGLVFLLWAVSVSIVGWGCAIAMADAEADGKFLLAFKGGLDDPDQTLFNWNASVPVCDWAGVVCDQTRSVVTGLEVVSSRVSGPLSPALCGIAALQTLFVSNTSINGSFSAGLFNCTGLTALTVKASAMEGPLPDGFSAFTQLRELDLSNCSFSGSLPPSIGGMGQLTSLNMSYNQLTGGIPDSFKQLAGLQYLLLHNNLLNESIPDFIGSLQELVFLDLSSNQVTGEIPDSIGDLSKLVCLSIGSNNISGAIPQSITRLQSLSRLYLYTNHLTGEFPSGMGNMTNMTDFEADMNGLVGPLPPDLGQWKRLQTFTAAINGISGGFPQGLSDLTELQGLSLFLNQMSGTIPQEFGLNTQLVRFEVSDNGFSGPMPPYLCNGNRMHTIAMQNNSFTGDFPSTYSNCSSLRTLDIYQNNLTGNLPKELWASSVLFYLDISSNNFSGSIPPEVGGAVDRTTMNIDNNAFSGTLPSEIGQMVELTRFHAANNRFEGPIPAALGQLKNLLELDLDSNLLSKPIPDAIGYCVSLNQLTLANNQLSGSIPVSLSQLPSLAILDLSSNRLTGPIPPSLGSGNQSALSLNLTNNDLSGPLPSAYTGGTASEDFLGNPRLCGPGLQVPKPCSSPAEKWPWILGCTFGVAALLLVTGCCCFVRKYRTHRIQGGRLWNMSSFQKVGFTEYDLLQNLTEQNVIGKGAAGKVYKVTLPDGQIVAVKKLHGIGSWDSKHGDYGFKAEVETLGKNTRHRNIVKLLCCCSSRDCNLLVYEYMKQGSLGQLLHHSSNGAVLDWSTRLRIAVGAANGLAYLHHDAPDGQILHRDVKSNNILVGVNWEARLSDFGLAKLLETYNKGDITATRLAGSAGYIAPEYGYTFKVTEKSDIYSFGVVLLELVTGMRPIEPEVYGEGASIVNWVHDICGTEKGREEVLDSRLVWEGKESMLNVLQVAVLCTNQSPSKRPTMRDVVDMLVQCGPPGEKENLLKLVGPGG